MIKMRTTRLETFSDGVIAIILTIMVLELHVPHGGSFDTLRPLVPAFISYILSFIYVGIYWNNHHHMMHATERVSGRILWANLHLLFWLSLIPFVTGWMGENNFAQAPTALYGSVLLMSAFAYTVLQRTILKELGETSVLGQAVGNDLKGKISLALYAAAIGASFFVLWVPQVLFAFVALIWMVPDRRIEKKLEES